jgi:hypothetical protein
VRIARRRLQALVGNEDSRDLQTFGGTEYDILDVSGRRIRIDPDLQTSPLLHGLCSSNLQRVKQSPTGRSDFPDRLIERRLIGLRRRVEPADLPNELKGGVVKLLLTWLFMWTSQPLDVSAHTCVSFKVIQPPPLTPAHFTIHRVEVPMYSYKQEFRGFGFGRIWKRKRK